MLWWVMVQNEQKLKPSNAERNSMAEADIKGLESNVQEVQKKGSQTTDTSHIIRKRLPNRLPKRPNDIYVTRRSNFKSELLKCEKLLGSGEPEIFVHGMGSAVNQAVNLALQLETKYLGTVQLAVNTSTITVIDDLEPVDDDATYETQTRQNSAIHIHIFRKALVSAQK